MRLFSSSATTKVLAVTAPPTPAWVLLLSDPTDPRTRRWATSAQTAVHEWAAQLLVWVPFLTSQMAGQARRLISLASIVTTGKKYFYLSGLKLTVVAEAEHMLPKQYLNNLLDR